MPGYRDFALSPGQAVLRGSFDTNNTSAPDGIRGSGFTVTRTGVGVFRVALANPPDYYTQFDHYECDIHAQGYSAKVTAEDSDDRTYGPYIVITTYDDEASAGAGAAADTTDKKVTFSITVRHGAAGIDGT